ncbi:MAG: hypothetical protein AABO57_22970 [Acidobacteriota bacterium]
MTLAETSASFLAFIRQKESGFSQPRSTVHEKALLLLTGYFSPNIPLSEITPARLRDFVARWYVERASTSKHPDAESARGNLHSAATRAIDGSRDPNTQANEPNVVLQPSELLDSLARFFKWVGRQTGIDLAERSSAVLLELSHSLPRALEITEMLSSWLRERGGAFNFPEFLTSFEEGGHSQYDIDTPGNIGALEGYFRIVRVEGSSVEAEEMLSEERVWPIVFPPEVAAVLDEQYIINLELVRTAVGWQIAGCGFAYPPGTDV